jgi:fumarate hydratase class II
MACMEPVMTPSAASAATRTETDSFGPIAVAQDRYWGAQTQRSLENFRIGGPEERMPLPLLHALVRIKRAAAEVNSELGLLAPDIAKAIIAAADEGLTGAFDDHFPLVVWQTGSGTQSNMNVNEVLASRANEMMGGKRGGKSPVHPNDHVNLGQSSNDCVPTAMHVAIALGVTRGLLPALSGLEHAIAVKAEAFASLVKIGRTHLQDATPVTLGQEFGAYAAQLHHGRARIATLLPEVLGLAQGGTAVGTGLNTHPEFSERVADRLAEACGLPFTPASNLFEALASHDALVALHGAIEAMAMGLAKIGGDIRLMGSGPRSGLGELSLPENEPGSSIMPGKVNPTQVEALTMVAARIHGNQTTIAHAASQGHFELNVMKPVIAQAMLQSIRLLGDMAESFRAHCIEGLKANESRLEELLERSLMLVTALAPEIGYDRAAGIAKSAHKSGATLREASLEAGVSAELFDRVVNARLMLAPSRGKG